MAISATQHFPFLEEKVKTIVYRIPTATSLWIMILATGTMTTIGVGNVWAENFSSTFEPYTTVGTDNDDDNIFGQGREDNASRSVGVGEGDDDHNYIELDDTGNNQINGTSECTTIVHHEFGGPANDIISGAHLVTGGPGEDIIVFGNCGGVAYGESGNDELIGGHVAVEFHGGDGNDKLKGSDSDDDDQLFGDEGDDTLTGRGGADYFSCGPGIDTITDFNTAEGDTKTDDCENF
jgi:Ca2+-binding RTX toxin-like protein